jgi:spore coat polysaccharide biosynthesis predicted glycosyltransferase SpsG
MLTRLRGVALATANAMQTELTAPLQAPLAGEQGVGFVYLVMLSFGGSPRLDLARSVLAALAAAHYDQQVLLMPAGPAGVSELPQYPFSLSALPAGGGFYEHLAGCDLLICAGGLTAYEAAFLGVPTICIALNEHQLATATKLAANGCSISAGMHKDLDAAALGRSIGALLFDSAQRSRMSAAGQALTDGRGLLRTAELILELLPTANLA